MVFNKSTDVVPCHTILRGSRIYSHFLIMGKLHETTFTEILPLPFRVAVLFQLGVHLWYAIVWTCYHVYDINCLALLNLSYSNHNYALDEHASGVVTGLMATIVAADSKENLILLRGIQSTASRLFSAVVGSLVCYWSCKALLNPETFVYAPIVNTIYLFVLVFSIYTVFSRGRTMGQQRVNSSIKRILIGNINSSTMRTNDIFFADSLTSYAKVLNDLMCFVWITFFASDNLYNTRVEALVLSYPVLVRMKQCFYEYRTTNQKQHLFNFMKYSALLGPILVNMSIKLSMLKLSTTTETSTTDLDKLNNWWYLASAISSLYLFTWDVHMDWGLGLFQPLLGRKSTKYYPIRSKLVFRRHAIYYSIIIFDFMIRFIWVFKIFVLMETEIELGLRHRVGNFLFGYNFLLVGYVILETLELLRRWLWCFLKWENDMSKLQMSDPETIQMADLKSG